MKARFFRGTAAMLGIASAVADLTCNYFRCHSLCYSADPFPPGTSRSAAEESKAEGENDK